MSKTPTPLLGFNNNVKHQGRVFHIQTEDSGVKRPRIVTHLFADGGRIVKTSRTDYSEHVGREDMVPVVKRIMKEQHKAMFIALRAGDFDELIEQACGPSLEPPAPDTARAALESETKLENTNESVPPSSRSRHRGQQLSNPNLRRTMPSVPGVEDIDLNVEALEDYPRRPVPPPPPVRRPSADRPAASAGRRRPPPLPSRGTPAHGTPATPPPPESRPGRYAPSRPAAIFGETTPAQQSIFGENVISEKSLDEVILSYLAEDLEGSSQD